LTEIPEHLLERSRSRRAALGLEGGSAAPATSESPGAAPSAAPAAKAPAKAAAAAPVPIAARPEVTLSPYARAAERRKKIPFWAVPVLLFLPLWAFLYWGTLDAPPAEVAGLLAVGQEQYGSCVACHAASGAGVGAIPGLTESHLTFPDYAGQVWWVVNGSAAVSQGAPYGDPNRPGGQRISMGGMPAWGNALTARQILGVVYYERARFSGALPAELEEIEAIADNPNLPERFEEGTTLEEITELLERLVPGTPAS
jgi:mono/diheme cytochrome c family protein